MVIIVVVVVVVAAAVVVAVAVVVILVAVTVRGGIGALGIVVINPFGSSPAATKSSHLDTKRERRAGGVRR